ncbi:MAG: signal peptidase I [Clostridia bacterium]|nr:signal peptidase I [Clostridia bacterium]
MNENDLSTPEKETQYAGPEETPSPDNGETAPDNTAQYAEPEEVPSLDNSETAPAGEENRPARRRPLRARRTLSHPDETEKAAQGENESNEVYLNASAEPMQDEPDIADIYPDKATGVFEDSLPQAADIAAELEEAEQRAAQAQEEPDPDGEEKLPPSVAVFDWIKSILLSFAVVIFTFTVLFRGSTVVGSSMMNTLHNGERVIISDFLYTPRGGDIVVVHTPTYKNGKDFLIKRVIAVGGQTVKINFNAWQIWVDGVPLDEPYVLKQDAPMISESLQADDNGEVTFTVKEDHVFVMGDNRNDSLDSRSEQIGQINKQYILGKVILRYLPFNAFGPVS